MTKSVKKLLLASGNNQYELVVPDTATLATKLQLEAVLEDVDNKVDKVNGKQLSTEDFTTALKNKLNSLYNYDDTDISNAVASLRNDFDSLVSGDTTEAIKTFNEVIDFLDGISDTEDLSAIVASIELQIAAKQDKITNLVTYNGTLTSGQVATFDGTSGKIKSSGFTVNKSVPADAKFTDTTYSDATQSAHGLMSTNDKKKLDGIASGAEVNVQSDWNVTDTTSDAYVKNKPALKSVATSGSYNDLTNKPTFLTGGSQTTTSSADGGTNVYTFTKSDGTTSTLSVKNGSKGSKGDKGDKGDTGETGPQGPQGPAGTNATTTAVASTTANGLMSSDMVKKLNGIAANATANVGTITGIKMNGLSKGTSGVVDLGTVITAHQDISGKLDSTTAASIYLTKTDAASTYLAKTAKAASATKADKDGSGNVITSTYATKDEVSDVQDLIDTLVSGNAADAIESFNEIIAFLEGVKDTETLDGIIAGINTEIAKKANESDAITNITRNGTTFTATKADGTQFTFSQQDSNTTYTAGKGLTLSSTTFNVGAGTGISVADDTVGLAESGVTAGTYGDDEATRTLTHSDVFDVPQITVDAYGRITSASTKTLTLPASGNTDTYTSAYCSTAAGTAAKTATCTGYSLLANSYLHITMVNANTSKTALTLNVNGKGAKPIYINGNASSTSNYTLPAGTYLIYYNGTNYYFRTDGAITGKTTSVPNHSADQITSGYLNIHPENGPVLIPMINNDIAHLLKRGGSAAVTYDGVSKNVDLTNAFDGSPSYVSQSPSGVTNIVIELTLHKTFGWSNTVYVDFGSANWRAKSIKLEVINTGYASDVWTQKGNVTNNGSGHYAVSVSHTPVGASNLGGGFNKIRFTFGSFNSTSDFRIAALGIYNYGSAGLRETFIPRDGGVTYGGLYPIKNNTYDLGTSDYKWGKVYATYLYGDSQNLSKMTAATASAAGKAGIVPAPGAGKQNSFLRGDGTWVVPTNTTYNNATTSTSGLMSSADKLKLDGITASADTVAFSANATSGNKVGTITINGTATTMYSPTLTTVSGNAGTATTLETARTIDGVSFDGSTNITHFGTCSTAAATAAKTVSLTGFTLATGARIAVKFTVTNTAANPTLNVNSTGAKSIMYRGSAISAGYLAANRVYEFVYDGTDYELIGDINTDTNTTYESKAAANGGTAVSLVTTGEKYAWNAKTSNTGTVTSVATGAGLTGGSITTSGTIKANLKSETKSTLEAAAMGDTASRQYAVGLDKNGKLSVNVPWTNTTYTSKAAANNGTEVSLVTTGEKAIWNAKTSNTGTITGVKVNGASVATSGLADIGYVVKGANNEITEARVVSELPSSPNATTLYIII